MVRNRATSATTTLLEQIGRFADGASLAQLLAENPQLPRRTVQRALQTLVREGRVRAAGQARARRYFPKTPVLASREQEDAFPGFIPLSPDSRDILDYIDQPVAARKPVGYRRAFLDSYEPNQTWYLPAPLRRQLRRIGETGQTHLPAGTYGRALLHRLLIDLSWASSHLEGNTYSRLDTRELIEHGKIARGKAAAETQMILNHKAAIELLIENADTVSFNRFTILNLHSMLAENLLPNPADEGRLRLHPVEIGKNAFRPLAVPALVEELFDTLLEKAARISDPYEQSFFVMVHLPYLQPFTDVNKRTSRLAANLPLLRANLCPLTFLDVPEQAYTRALLGVYELTRIELLRDLYVWAYERSAQEYLTIRRDLVEPDPVRLTYRDEIRRSVREIVRQPGQDPMAILERQLDEQINEPDRANVRAMIVEELRRLHEGNAARYGLRRSEFLRWQERQERPEPASGREGKTGTLSREGLRFTPPATSPARPRNT